MTKPRKTKLGSGKAASTKRAGRELGADDVACRCRSGCKTGRCACRGVGKRCSEACSCKDCANPFQQLELEEPSACLVQNVQAYLELPAKQRQLELKLPCGHGTAKLSQLLGDYSCPKCDEVYWYSFCWDEVVQDSCSWHCKVCRTCRDWREWHCESCNRCTYGVSLPCENCSDAGPAMDFW
jgi:hypothetical protein